MTDRRPLLLFLALAALLLAACVGPIAERDQFNSTPTIYSPGQYVTKGLCAPLNIPQPCTCMICTNNTGAQANLPDAIKATLASLFGNRIIEATLANSHCDFYACNSTSYNDTITAARTSGYAQCKLNGNDVPCFPRYFMLGQGASSAEFSLAQRYCDGRLTMAVLWASSLKNRLPTPPALPVAPPASSLTCYQVRNQLPVIVYYSGALWDTTTSNDFQKFAATYSTHASPPPSPPGPVILTTEAMLDPYDNYASPDGSWKILINSTKLRKVDDQITAFKSGCPDCLIALALKPTLYPNGVPDLCASEYFLGNPADPIDTAFADSCKIQYDDGGALLASRGMHKNDVDLMGVGFIVNEDPHIASNSAEGVMGKYLSFSIQSLKLYPALPSIWYAVGISPGATLTPATRFTESDVAGLYNGMLGELSALSAAGVIGVAPYRFLDDPTSAPRECKVAVYKFDSTLSSLDEVKGPSGSPTVYTTLHDSANQQSVVVDRVLLTNATDVIFASADGMQYDARLENGRVRVYLRGCQYGFSTSQGSLRNMAAHAWFSSCQYYYTNEDTSSTSATNPVAVDSTPTHRALEQPVMYSDNGQGSVCADFSTRKMYNRIYSGSGGATPDPSAFKLSTDPSIQARFSQLQCGACMADKPMPAVFCALGSRLPTAETAFTKAACTQYPQMDDAFLLQNADPVLMRALASATSGLGKKVDCPPNHPNCDPNSNPKLSPVGPDAPACHIQFGSDPAGCNAAGKDLASLQSKASDYCFADDISNNDQPTTGKPYACGLGVLRTSDFPTSLSDCGGSSYSPFDPYQSACSGTHYLIANFTAAFQKVGELEVQNPDILSEVAGNEPWYALLLSAYQYDGVTFPDDRQNDALRYYDPATLPSFAEYVWAVAKAHYPDKADFGLSVVMRYNKALRRCSSGCLHQSCPVSSGGNGGDSGGDDDTTGEVFP